MFDGDCKGVASAVDAPRWIRHRLGGGSGYVKRAVRWDGVKTILRCAERGEGSEGRWKGDSEFRIFLSGYGKLKIYLGQCAEETGFRD